MKNLMLFIMNDLLIERLEYLKKIMPVRNLNEQNPVVVLLDPGHGGMINGKYVTAPDKMADHGFFTFYEGLWNRVVVWMTAQVMFLNNQSYHIIVPEDKDITVYERVRRAEAIAKEFRGTVYKPYYHSVHGNAHGQSQANGVEIYTSPGYTKSDPIATLYYQQLIKLGWKMRNDFSDGDPDKEERFYVLVNTSMPAILSETGFYTNPEEVRRMMNMDNIKMIAELFVRAHKEVVHLNLI